MHYYLNTNEQTSGDYEVHCETCKFMPDIDNRLYLGYFSNCADAVARAKALRPYLSKHINGCWFCCRPCNKG